MDKELIHKGKFLQDDQRDHEYRARKKDIEENTIPIGLDIPEGWKEKKKYKTKIKIFKQKGIPEYLEENHR